MKRFLLGVVLFIFIILCAGFLTGRLWAGGAEGNFFNTRYRPALARQLLFRQFFGLHETGDAKSDYLGPRYRYILLEVDSMAGYNPSPGVMSELADRIKEVTGKQTSVYFSDIDIPDQGPLGQAGIDRLTAAYRNNRSQGNTAVVYVLVLNAPPTNEDPTLLGATHREDEIILFTKALRDFTADSTSTYDNYELSTALHEFGHLLGLPHNEQPGCLMNARAEADHLPQYSAADVVTRFCDYERQLIGQSH